jgi:hypothetical protein
MKAADARQRDHAACARRFDGARDRRVSAEGHVRAVVVVVGDVEADQSEQVPFPEHDHVVEHLSAERPHPARCETVLPWRARCSAQLLDAEVGGACVEHSSIDPISITDKPSRRVVGPDRLHDLLRRPRRMRLRRHIHMHVHESGWHAINAQTRAGQDQSVSMGPKHASGTGEARSCTQRT